MPIEESAKKELRKNKKNKAKNLTVKIALKEKIKFLRKALAAQKTDEAKKLLPAVIKAADKAAQKGVIKKNAAARYKSRLSRQLNNLTKPA